MPERDPQKDALTLRADLFRLASSFCVPIAAAIIAFLLSHPEASGTWIAVALAAAAILFGGCGAFCIFALSNTAHSVDRGNYELDRPGKFSLLLIYLTVSAGTATLIVSFLAFVFLPPARDPNPPPPITLQPHPQLPRIQTLLSYSIGPFAEGDHQLSEVASNDVKALGERLAAIGTERFALILIIGGVDKRPLSGRLRSVYGSSLGLAQARAESVREALVSSLGDQIDHSLAVTLAAGPEHIGDDVSQHFLERDRSVTVIALGTAGGSQ